MKDWWKLLIAAISSFILILKGWFSRDSKAKKEAYEKAEQEIDNDGDTADLQSSIDDLFNRL
jgi:hypothetical protein